MNISNSPASTCGYDTQDINRIVQQCNFYDNQRNRFYNELSKYYKFTPYDIKVHGRADLVEYSTNWLNFAVFG